MTFVPVDTMRNVVRSLVHGEGQRIIYRRATITNNPSTGTPTVSNADTPCVAFVGKRKAKFINGTLIVQNGERVLIAADDLDIVPIAGDTVILAATDVADYRRKVVTTKITGTQGISLLYTVEVE